VYFSGTYPFRRKIYFLGMIPGSVNSARIKNIIVNIKREILRMGISISKLNEKKFLAINPKYSENTIKIESQVYIETGRSDKGPHIISPFR